MKSATSIFRSSSHPACRLSQKRAHHDVVIDIRKEVPCKRSAQHDVVVRRGGRRFYIAINRLRWSRRESNLAKLEGQEGTNTASWGQNYAILTSSTHEVRDRRGQRRTKRPANRHSLRDAIDRAIRLIDAGKTGEGREVLLSVLSVKQRDK